MADHARLSPSAAHRWMRCAGALKLESAYPDTSSSYADEGTAAHAFAAAALENDLTSAELIGRTTTVGDQVYVCDQDMANYLEVYLRHVRSTPGVLLVEQRLDYGQALGFDNQFGTADAVLFEDDVVTVIDLKYGRGVPVYADGNEQLMCYALGAVATFALIYAIERVRLCVVQPRLGADGHIDTVEMTIDELDAFAAQARERGLLALSFFQPDVAEPTIDDLSPGDKACQWCKAKASCPALQAETLRALTTDAAHDLSALALADAANRVALVEQWAAAIRAELQARLEAGASIPGWKLVAGRRGARKWSDVVEAERVLKSFRLTKEEIYDYSIISPTTAEKLLRETPKRWTKLEPLIDRAEGKPVAVPSTDKRPAIVVSFDSVESA